MRSLTRRLEELAQATMPDTGLKGSLNPKQLAELLGVSDLQTFTRSMNKIRAGDADKLTRMEMTELAEAFVRLLAAEAEDTQKAMQALKRVSAKEEPTMEAFPSKSLQSSYRINDAEAWEHACSLDGAECHADPGVDNKGILKVVDAWASAELKKYVEDLRRQGKAKPIADFTHRDISGKAIQIPPKK
jgi:hypothetical protein